MLKAVIAPDDIGYPNLKPQWFGNMLDMLESVTLAHQNPPRARLTRHGCRDPAQSGTCLRGRRQDGSGQAEAELLIRKYPTDPSAQGEGPFKSDALSRFFRHLPISPTAPDAKQGECRRFGTDVSGGCHIQKTLADRRGSCRSGCNYHVTKSDGVKPGPLLPRRPNSPEPSFHRPHPASPRKHRFPSSNPDGPVVKTSGSLLLATYAVASSTNR